MSALAEKQASAVAESNTVSMFERLAKDPGVDVAKLEKLMELQERAIKRNAEAAYHAALAGMQSEIPSISEHGAIKHGDKIISKYALFEDINDAIKPILQRHGFAISFRTAVAANALTVTGILSHREGHHEETALPLPFDTSGAKNAVQAIGSSVSYGKRYVMCALLNITTRGEDDDGNKAGAGQVITAEQADTLDTLIENVGADKVKFLRYMKIGKLEDLPAQAYATAVELINAKRKRA
jgi:hypothetical protein